MIMTERSPVLPISLKDGLSMDFKQAYEVGQTYMDEYAFAEPFPHSVLDDFLPLDLANQILEHFPSEKKTHDKVYEKGYGGTHKRQIMPADCDEFVQRLFAFFNSSSMLKFLEGVTNIKGLLPDPYFAGGGFHETTTGGLLGIHADFRVNEELQLIRRVNVLIYLNKDWLDSYGGCLELWDKGMQKRIKSVAPIFNRCVIFNTDSDSFHGHPDPLTTPEDVTRRSIALYYYTAQKIENTSGESRHTNYVARPNDSPQNIADAKKLARKREKRARKRFKHDESGRVKYFIAELKRKFSQLVK
jgi:hypothetical protein